MELGEDLFYPESFLISELEVHLWEKIAIGRVGRLWVVTLRKSVLPKVTLKHHAGKLPLN